MSRRGTRADKFLTAARQITQRPVTATQTMEPENIFLIFEKLNMAEDKTTMQPAYRDLLSAAKKGEGEKILASQLISKYVEFFPLLHYDAVDALICLYEDNDVSIRKQVIKDLTVVCEKVTRFIPKIADLFGQFLQTPDAEELMIVKESLTNLFNIDPQAAFVGLFSQIEIGEDIVRKQCLRFLSTKLLTDSFGPKIFTVEFEDMLIYEVKRIIGNLNCSDFKTLMSILIQAKFPKTVSSQQTMVVLIADLLESKKHFDASKLESIEILLACSRYALSLFSSKVSSAPFFINFCRRILPNLNVPINLRHGETSLIFQALKMMTECTFYLKPIDYAEVTKYLDSVYNELTVMSSEVHDVTLRLGQVECLLFMVHKLCQHQPKMLENSAKVRSIKQLLFFFLGEVGRYLQRLRTCPAPNYLHIPESFINIIVNVIGMIKDIYYYPEDYNTVIELSWHPILKPGIFFRHSYTLRNTKAPETISSYDPSTTFGAGEHERVLCQPPSARLSCRPNPYVSPPISRRGRAGRGSSSSFRGREYRRPGFRRKR